MALTDSQKQAQKKYRTSAKGKAAHAKYIESKKGAVAVARYRTSEKGKAAKQRAEQNYRAKPEIAHKQAGYMKQYAESGGLKISRDKTRGARLAAVREKRTGVSASMFESLMLLQQGKCAVCSADLGARPHADHCHDTGKPRGLLCIMCNTIEGKIKKLGLTAHGFADRLQQYLDNPPARIVDLL